MKHKQYNSNREKEILLVDKPSNWDYLSMLQHKKKNCNSIKQALDSCIASILPQLNKTSNCQNPLINVYRRAAKPLKCRQLYQETRANAAKQKIILVYIKQHSGMDNQKSKNISPGTV